MKTKLVLVVLAAALVGINGRLAAEDAPEKWFVVEEAVNTQSSFMLRVDVDKPDRVYAVGEHMRVAVKPDRDCYLYLLYYGAGNEVVCLFPNKYQQDNLVRANTLVKVPAEDDEFQFTAAAPCGKEVLQVIGTLKPFNVLQAQDLTKGRATPLDTGDLKDMVVELKKGKQRDWAEARIQITTVSDPDDKPSSKGKRYAVCVGISQYQHNRVPPLQVCHKDAQRMAEALKQHCQVDDVVLLTNSQATAAAIEKAIFKDLVRKSKPGDDVFIFFSCHGGRTADTNGDEKDGLDEYLVPHDGTLGKPETMILDDTFARWVRELDGRKVAIILDNCYSGGSSKAAKGLGDPKSAGGPLDFLDGEMKRAKDLGQSGTMVLAACQANQLAWEMPSEQEGDKGSVLTYYVLAALDDRGTDKNGDGRVSLGEVYRHIKNSVEEYVRKTFSAEQNPVLLDNANDGIILQTAR